MLIDIQKNLQYAVVQCPFLFIQDIGKIPCSSCVFIADFDVFIKILNMNIETVCVMPYSFFWFYIVFF